MVTYQIYVVISFLLLILFSFADRHSTTYENFAGSKVPVQVDVLGSSLDSEPRAKIVGFVAIHVLVCEPDAMEGVQGRIHFRRSMGVG